MFRHKDQLFEGSFGHVPTLTLHRKTDSLLIRQISSFVIFILDKEGPEMNNQNLIKIFEYALNQEETGKSFFESSLKRMGWGAAMTAFTQLIREEEKHILFIKNILEDLKRGGPAKLNIEKGPELEKTDFFDERAKSEFLQELLYESMIPDVTVFSVAWLIEKDLSEFYEKMASRTEGKAKEALQMLADWEKGHERFFREYRDKLTEIYSNMPWGG
jgi:rubrerythrin